MKKILVIDDDVAIQSLTVKALQSRGYQTLVAADGREGLEAARKYLPDLIVSDIQMPNMDGYETLAALQSDPTTSTIPFIFLTGVTDHRLIRYGMGLGADDYLTKPFTVSELVNAVATRLAKKEVIERFSEKRLSQLRENIGMALPHELLTPLNGILGLAGMLADEESKLDEQDIRETARSIQMSGLRLHRLIFNFVVYSELELIRSDPSKVEDLRAGDGVSLSSLLLSTAKEKAESVARGADLEIEVEECEVVIDPERFRKALEELLDNACKFSKAGTPVRVTLRPEGNRCVLCVTDQGRGMTEDQIRNIGAHMQFERRFFEQQGTGLGLIIAKRIAEVHGGELTIQSVPNRQTEVRMALPCRRR